MTAARPTRRGLVLGAGGIVGYAWAVCALRRLEKATGWDPREASLLIGTSAGSVLATELAAGVSVTELYDALYARVRRGTGTSPGAHLPPKPHLRPLSWSMVRAGLRGALPLRVALTGLLPEGRADSGILSRTVEAHVPEGQWVKHPRCLVVAVDCQSGRRVAFGRDREASSREAVRASCAVPGWFAPVAIGGRRYMDGGVVSPTSLDLAATEAVDEVIVVSPLTSPNRVPASSIGEAFERTLRAMMSRVLDAEAAVCERAGKQVLRIEPTAPELALMGPNFMDARRRAAMMDAWI